MSVHTAGHIHASEESQNKGHFETSSFCLFQQVFVRSSRFLFVPAVIVRSSSVFVVVQAINHLPSRKKDGDTQLGMQLSVTEQLALSYLHDG